MIAATSAVVHPASISITTAMKSGDPRGEGLRTAACTQSYPKGFALDASHRPHITMLQRFVRTADLDKVYAAANKVLASTNPTRWKLKAVKYYYIPDPPNGVAGIVSLNQRKNICSACNKY